MWNMTKRPWVSILISLVAIGVVLAVWQWDWLASGWPWLGDMNGRETNSATRVTCL